MLNMKGPPHQSIYYATMRIAAQHCESRHSKSKPLRICSVNDGDVLQLISSHDRDRVFVLNKDFDQGLEAAVEIV